MLKIGFISEKIKTIRRQRNVKQTELADAIGISHRHLQTIESGTSDFKVSFLEKISNALEVPACYLLHNESPQLSKAGIFCKGELIHRIPMGVHVTSTKGEILFTNGYLESRLQIPTSNETNYYHQLFSQEILQERIKNLLKTPKLAEGQVFFGEVKLIDKSSVPVRIECANYQRSDAADSVAGFIFLTSLKLTW
jgi:transcriptional regulator with XRE-family HTH domain